MTNLFGLTADDIVWMGCGMVLFNKNHAQRIRDFVETGSLSLLIHCQAGISRSGAIGFITVIRTENLIQVLLLLRGDMFPPDFVT